MKYLIFSIFWFLSLAASSQNSPHMELLSYVNIPEEASSIWGITINDHEIALLGTSEGLRVYDLLNPKNPTELVFIKCTTNSWRELKSYGDFAYVVTEGGDGLLIINLSDLKNIQYHFLKECYSIQGDSIPLNSSHTIFIDEKGFLYLAGSSNGGYGVCILDASKNPENPSFVNNMTDSYFHEVYVANDTMYAAELFNGYIGIYDIHDRQHPVKINDQKTAYDFTHSSWLEKNRKILYTADEVSGAFVQAFDVSNPLKIKLADQFRTGNIDAKKIIPHNVFHREPFLFISYYTEGVKVLDTRDPENLIEVAQYDSYPENDFGFHGCWSVYPFFKSGIIIGSDIEHGMFVLKFDENRAKYLIGTIYDKSTNQRISNARIQLKNMSIENEEFSSLNGSYKTGLAESGQTAVSISKKGYKTIQTSVTLSSDSTIQLDFYLEPLAVYNVKLHVVNDNNSQNIPEANIKIWNENFSYDGITNGEGIVVLENVYEGEYEIAAGKWAFRDHSIGKKLIISDDQFTINLKNGYDDNFIFDHGWKQVKTDSLVNFVRSDFSEFERAFSNFPSADIPDDIGTFCYYTDNFDKIFEEFRLHEHLYLISPRIDLSGYDEAKLSYYPWSYGGGEDAIKECFLTIGNDTVPLEQIYENLNGKFNKQSNFIISLKAKEKSDIHFIMHLYNNPLNLAAGNSLRAALDKFEMYGTVVSDVDQDISAKSIAIFPIPSTKELTINYSNSSPTTIKILNCIGEEIMHLPLELSNHHKINIESLPAGIYFLQLPNEVELKKFIKL